MQQGNRSGLDPTDPCGSTVAVIAGAKPTERLEALDKKCPAGNKITIQEVPGTLQGDGEQDGTYAAILKKWGTSDDAVPRFEVDPKSP